MIEVRRYVTASGKDGIGHWLAGLKDRQARARVLTRLTRLALGNFGDCKALREGVQELRIDVGPGYREYFARLGTRVVLLLCGGDKRRQGVDIENAVECLRDYRRRES